MTISETKHLLLPSREKNNPLVCSSSETNSFITISPKRTHNRIWTFNQRILLIPSPLIVIRDSISSWTWTRHVYLMRIIRTPQPVAVWTRPVTVSKNALLEYMQYFRRSMYKAVEGTCTCKSYCPVDDKLVILLMSKAFNYFQARWNKIDGAFDPP